jgi:hypothetical protein
MLVSISEMLEAVSFLVHDAFLELRYTASSDMLPISQGSCWLSRGQFFSPLCDLFAGNPCLPLAFAFAAPRVFGNSLLSIFETLSRKCTTTKWGAVWGMCRGLQSKPYASRDPDGIASRIREYILLSQGGKDNVHPMQ